ncbi:MAG: hypothetical protein KGL52_12495 [Rhodospirillales bacterium]|jgi:hypothetical protein|nr:hypothetical protein [Rhodospirillales bacterium]
MSEAAPPASAPVPAAAAAGAPPAPQRIVELKVSGHLMTLDAGLFCIFQPPGAPVAGSAGLPGVRISAAPAGREGVVSISTFRNDGWLGGGDGAALVRVAQGPAQILVTIYQAPDAHAEQAPRLQVLRLSGDPTVRPAAPRPPGGRVSAPEASAELVAHVQSTGDVGARMGEWLGVRGSKLCIEGFSIAPGAGLPASVEECLEYQAVLGRDWLSPWVAGGGFCGSRGMALPLLGLNVRLKGKAARTHECQVTASFVDGSLVGPSPGGMVVQAESRAPLEAFQVRIAPRAAGAAPPAGAAQTPGLRSASSPGAVGGSAPATPPPEAAPTPARRKTARRPR